MKYEDVDLSIQRSSHILYVISFGILNYPYNIFF
jgi:hypothetical protein